MGSRQKLKELIVEHDLVVRSNDSGPWTDLRVPLSMAKGGGVKEPSFDAVLDNGSGSQGVYLYVFADNEEQELFFVAQMPHGYKHGSDLKPHMHWMPISATLPTAGEGVTWGLEYTVANVNGTYGNTTIITAEYDFDTDGALTQYQHALTSFPDIDGSALKLSHCIIGRIFRDVTDANDTYGQSVAGIEIDFHYQLESFGSSELFTKPENYYSKATGE